VAPDGRRAADRDPDAYRAWLLLEWAGPWERLLDWLTPQVTFPAPPARGIVARWLIRRDEAWRDGYAARLAKPPARWRRRRRPG